MAEVAVQFGALDIPGLVLADFVVGPAQLVSMDTHFFGLFGESRITGGEAGRMVEVPVWIYDDFRRQQDLHQLLKRIGDIQSRGEVDTLNVNSAADWPIFKNCTLEGFQVTRGPLPDVAGTLDHSWHCRGVLRFKQLYVP